MNLKEKLNKIKSLQEQIKNEPMRFRELNAELGELQKEVDSHLAGMWDVTEEEKKEYTERYKKGEGLFRDEDCCYFERENKYPVRVERICPSEGDEYITVESVPFTGY